MVPPFAGSAGPVATAACGYDHELLVSEIASRTLGHDPVEPRLEGARRRKIVEREPDEDRTSRQDLVDELCADRERGRLGRRRGHGM